MKRMITGILLSLLVVSQGWAFDLWQGGGFGFGGSIAGLPGASAQTAFLPFDNAVNGSPSGTPIGTFTRAGNAYNPETGLIAPHNLMLNSAVFVTQSVTLTAQPHVLAFKGTGTITLGGTGSGTLAGTGANNQVTLTFTPTAGAVSFTLSGGAGTVTECQLNVQSLTPYVPTTTAAVYGPRYVTGKQGSAILIEESSTNLRTYSSDVSNNLASGVWLASGNVTAAPTRTNNTTDVLDPLGTNTAVKLVFPAVSSAGNYSLLATGTTTTLSAIPHTISFWVRGAVGGEQIEIAATPDGATYIRGMVTLTTSWARYSVTGTATATGWYIQIGGDKRASGPSISVQTVYVYSSQVEALPYATSYIPTTTASVTRAAEYATQPTSGVITAAQGTVMAWGYVDTAVQGAASVNHLISHGTSTTANLIRIWKNGANTWGFHVSDAAGTTTGADVAQTLSTGWHHFAITWGAAGTKGYIDGAEVVSDTTGVTVPASLAANYYIGSRMDGTLQWSNSIDNHRVFSIILTQQQIAQYVTRGK